MRVAAPPPTPLDGRPGGPLILRDGTVATVRAAGPADRAAVRAFFQQLSPESRHRRFLSAAAPPDAVIQRLCAEADRSHGVTLLAVRSIAGAERLLGVASYIRVNESVAEVAFAVGDEFGGLGIATALLERLSVLASQAGFARFQALTTLDNVEMLTVFRDSGFTIRSKLDGNSVDVELSLTPSSESVRACQERERTATAASIRPLLQPRAIAVVGASRDPASIGRRLLDALLGAGFDGPIYAVNRAATEVGGVKAFASIREAPRGIDLAVIAVPRDAVLGVVDDCAAAGVKSLVIITAGFAEAGDDGRALQRALLARVRGYGMRMVGPNCMGLLNAPLRLNASFSPIFPPSGRVAFSSQSGALGMAILALASERQIGLSTFVSIGNKADVSSNDLLQYWEEDPSTSIVLLYLESFGNPRRFARLARRIGRTKPIVAVKAGRTRAGSRAAGSHTAALAASELAVDALFRQAGVIRADTIDEMFDVAICLDTQPLPAGRRVAVVTNAGGPGILAVDACEAAGLNVVEFSAATRERLAAFLPPVANMSNPIDMVASAGPEEFRRSIEVALTADETDAVIVIYTPVDAGRSNAILEGIRNGIAAGRTAGAKSKPVLTCLMAESGHPVPLSAGGERVPAYAFPENAARALSKIATYATWRAQPPGLFWSFNDIRADEARELCGSIVDARGESWLTSEEVRRLAQAFGLPVVPSIVARSADEAAALASVMGFPVVAKLNAPQLVHKSEADGVRVNLTNAAGVRKAYADLMASARDRGIGDVEGVLVQPMVTGGTELLVGLVEDALFGPLVGTGLGGVNVEAFGDIRFRIAPLTDRDAEELVRDMHGFRLLDGFRGRPRADIEALQDIILRVARLAEEVPDILELDLNPVIVLPVGKGCRIVDARVKVGARRPAGPVAV